MGLIDIPSRVFKKRINIEAMFEREDALAARPGAIRSTDKSPVRFEIVVRALEMEGVRPPVTLKTLPHMVASHRGISRSLRAVEGNPEPPRTQIPAEELSELEQFARSQGVAATGYTRVPRRLVFRNKGVLFENAIVLVMEMDKEKIEAAPAPRAAEAVHETYHYLGDAANQIARYLQGRGYGSHAGHPLGGLVLYPPLGQMAGLGWRGRHGMLITPQFGPRVRLAAVFTSIENLPFFEGENVHRWVEGHCRTCGQCIRNCPTEAILEQSVERENGLVMCTDCEKCFPFFAEQHGCSVCIKVCPFSRVGYEKVKRAFDARQ